MQLFAVAAGGALGATARYLVAGWVQQSRFASPAFPLGTLVVNLSGCLAVGLLAGVLHERFVVAPATRAFLLVGLLGGYTTFSTFAFETATLLEEGSWGLAVTNGLGSPVAGLGGVLVGGLLARWV